MRVVFVLALFTQLGFSQQNQQFLQNNFSNMNVQFAGNSLNNNSKAIQVTSNKPNNLPKQTIRGTVRVRPINNIRRIARINNSSSPVTAQVRRVRQHNQPANNVPTLNNTLSNLNTDKSNENNASIINQPAAISQMDNTSDNNDIQVQNFVNDVKGSNPFLQQEAVNIGNQLNLNMDVSFNLKGLSIIKARSTSEGSSSHSKSRIFSKKMAKFKRHFFGKLTSHKKSKHRIDVCFAWKK